MSVETPIMDILLYHIEWLFSILKYQNFLKYSDIFPIISAKMLSVFTYCRSASPAVLSISGFIFSTIGKSSVLFPLFVIFT